MNPAKPLAFLAVLATIWGVVYLHDRAYRYEIVIAGAGSGGSGGSQENTGDRGDTEIKAYLLDRKSGKVWLVDGVVERPTLLLSCKDVDETDAESGCRKNE